MVAQQPLPLAGARQIFAEAIRDSEFIPGSAEITIRDEPELGDAAAVHCRWPLTEKGPYSGTHSREITVQIEAAALNRFRAAAPVERGQMLQRFEHVFNTRLLDGGYNEQDPSPPVFRVRIDVHALEP